MTTLRQIETNKQNAQLSTGAITVEGKAIVAKNAIKHGIFTKELIINNGDGKENAKDYEELLNNLIADLNPSGQMQYILVEKIAVDCWRLRRLIRFETGSICKYLDTILYDFYYKTNTFGERLNRSTEDIEDEITEAEKTMNVYDGCLQVIRTSSINIMQLVNTKAGSNNNISYEMQFVINTVLYEALKTIEAKIIDTLDMQELEAYETKELTLQQLKNIFKRIGLMEKDFIDMMNEKLEKLRQHANDKLYVLNQEKRKNELGAEAEVKMRGLPIECDTEKVMRYESALQKSILRNLIMLKKLQGVG